LTGYQRVLLKLSGEVFGGGGVGVDPDVVQTIAREIASVANAGVQILLVERSTVVEPPPALADEFLALVRRGLLVGGDVQPGTSRTGTRV